MSKIIFLDVDGTLIDYEAKLPAYSNAVTDTNVGAVVFTVDFN